MPEMAEGSADERVRPRAAGAKPCTASKHATSANGMIAVRMVDEGAKIEDLLPYDHSAPRHLLLTHNHIRTW
jgi:hypothetical protein